MADQDMTVVRRHLCDQRRDRFRQAMGIGRGLGLQDLRDTFDLGGFARRAVDGVAGNQHVDLAGARSGQRLGGSDGVENRALQGIVFSLGDDQDSHGPGLLRVCSR